MAASDTIPPQATATPARSIPDGLSVDVEDYYHVEAFADRIAPSQWPAFSSRVVDNNRRVLELFDCLGVKGTFFVLGCVAERHPQIVRDILAAGHELGCHSYGHQRIHRLTPQDFRADTRRALAILQDAGGQAVFAYRAPTFSVVRSTLWALRILAEEGIRYDSSVYPVVHDHYGVPEAPRFPYRFDCGDGIFLDEVPPPTVRWAGRNLAATGGGYLRILPMWYTRWSVRRLRREQRPVLVYFHPWELDPDQPRLEGSLKSRFRHYRNLGHMAERLREVISGGRFAPLREMLAAYRSAGELPTLSAQTL